MIVLSFCRRIKIWISKSSSLPLTKN